ncbi:endonuclease/exonuclease/phosphatase family protein [Zoogloea sp.]|uniref:endonuclease/exonuclease/phosphatase family protein n=1 Tax=Zoogloea sp. TaxID=49181 RepID=UPI0032200B6A
MQSQREAAPCKLTPEHLERLHTWIVRFRAAWHLIRKLCLLACLAYAFLAVLGMSLIQGLAEHVTVLAVANYAPPLLWLLPGLLLIPMVLVCRRGGAVFALLSVAGWWLLFFSGWKTPEKLSEAVGSGADVLRVITFNRGQAQRHSLRPFLAEIGPDVVALQDARGRSGHYRTDPAYAVFREVREEGEFVLLSRAMVLQQGALTGQNFQDPLGRPVPYGARWVIDWHGRPVAIYNVHFPSPRRHLGSPGFGRMLPQLAALVYGGDSQMDAYWRWRVDLAEDLAARLRRELLPWILLGDMNTPPRGVIHSLLLSTGEDLHLKVGGGFGHTFPGDTSNPLALAQPWMRLDYVFSDRKSWEARWIRLEEAARSQHLPLAAELIMNAP